MRTNVKEKRKLAVKRGMCGTCCIRRPSGGRKTCDVCSLPRAQIRQRTPPFCTDCQRANGHRHDCPSPR